MVLRGRILIRSKPLRESAPVTWKVSRQAGEMWGCPLCDTKFLGQHSFLRISQEETLGTGMTFLILDSLQQVISLFLTQPPGLRIPQISCKNE